MPDYGEFLKSKKMTVVGRGIDIDCRDVDNRLFDFQRDIVIWAAKMGRSAIFADTGLGKTLMQLEWSRLLGGDIFNYCAPERCSSNSSNGIFASGFIC